ncbi:poly-beta-hydroxybutyrate polymerase [Pseudoxanthomonas jiangsuensis]|uniref:PHA/PHB synthase family protein n=1 Tax=Pseudoxanthomonas jiangsuensis TaxID=619688 RepID=UPI0013909DC4|nr:alpha/beta fold hydrolase [Pseudoxanthomonas jiangsuensis]KAF1694888.1 poly-beta-hydroxybutyrate polymerase [Pseudoxanthomonas jiangsuensis]
MSNDNTNDKPAGDPDNATHAAWAKAWSHLSPESALMAWTDWASHLAVSPHKRADLLQLAQRQFEQMMAHLRDSLDSLAEGNTPPELPATDDRRFSDPAWGQYPFSLLRQSFEMQTHWWDQATQGVWGVDSGHQKFVQFAARQWLEAMSPTHFPLLNPQVLERTRAEEGNNLARGMSYLIDDTMRRLAGEVPAGLEDFKVGQNLAITPGKVVYRNALIELIQYAPSTPDVHPEPILIVPAWIMKYYILDLSPQNSLIKYLVEQGHTVFCISWNNPGKEDRHLGMDDYLAQGIDEALAAINAIVPKQRIHAAGYCLGGTLLSIAAAALARDGDDRLASVTLLAAQTDFSEPGDLSLFINESQIALLEAQMEETGYLRADQMGGAFQMLRSYDMVWSRLTQEYLLGDRRPMNDLMAWNADGTNMPAAMHSQYLRRMYLYNDLSGGRYLVRGRSISLGDITVPIFCVGTTTDHVAPWRSVFKIHLFSPAEITFALTNGGHNAGIVSEPGRPRRHYRLHTRQQGERYLAPDEWLETAGRHEGSWWSSWVAWLNEHSGPPMKSSRVALGGKRHPPLCNAPGTYVLKAC